MIHPRQTPYQRPVEHNLISILVHDGKTIVIARAVRPRGNPDRRGKHLAVSENPGAVWIAASLRSSQ
jgi:hypothetical protein